MMSTRDHIELINDMAFSLKLFLRSTRIWVTNNPC